MVVVDTEKKSTSILDPLVTSDKTELFRRHAEKVKLYKTTPVANWLQETYRIPESSFEVAGVILNFRGALLDASQKILKKLGIPCRLLEYLSVSLLTDTWYVWQAYQRTA